MPVPPQRDLDLTRRRLSGWFAAQRAQGNGGAGPRVDLRVPDGRGFSHETLLADVIWAGGRHTDRLVVRVAATGYRVMPGCRIEEEHAVMAALAATDVPVPRVYGFEPDPDVLGAPFLVMARHDGWTPPDLPSYHRAGPMVDLDPRDRAAVWWGGVEMLHRVHRLDPVGLGLAGLARSPDAPGGLAAQLGFYESHLDHFGCAGSPLVADALAALRDGLPAETGRPRLLWGDARMGNILYEGLVPAAVLDWEMAFLGPPEADLAWFLYLDRFLSHGIGTPRLTGLPDAAATVERYTALAGHTPRHLDWYELFAAFRFGVVTARVGRLLVEHGIVASAADVPLATNAARLLAETLKSL